MDLGFLKKKKLKKKKKILHVQEKRQQQQNKTTSRTSHEAKDECLLLSCQGWTFLEHFLSNGQLLTLQSRKNRTGDGGHTFLYMYGFTALTDSLRPLLGCLVAAEGVAGAAEAGASPVGVGVGVGRGVVGVRGVMGLRNNGNSYIEQL